MRKMFFRFYFCSFEEAKLIESIQWLALEKSSVWMWCFFFNFLMSPRDRWSYNNSFLCMEFPNRMKFYADSCFLCLSDVTLTRSITSNRVRFDHSLRIWTERVKYKNPTSHINWLNLLCQIKFHICFLYIQQSNKVLICEDELLLQLQNRKNQLYCNTPFFVNEQITQIVEFFFT